MNNKYELKEISQEDGAVSLQTAIDLFDQLADMDDIAFGYARDGCYARAHIMCRRMIDADLTPSKAWSSDGLEDGSDLKVNCEDGSEIYWGWHVAPALSVVLEDGNVVDMVFDPSLFDGPVSTEEWASIMNTTKEKVFVAAFGSAPPGQAGNYGLWANMSDETDKQAAATMVSYLGHQKTSQRTVFPSQSRQQMIETQQLPPSQSQLCGRTWKTGQNASQIKETQRLVELSQTVLSNIQSGDVAVEFREAAVKLSPESKPKGGILSSGIAKMKAWRQASRVERLR